ncbi:MAG: 2-dehydropantoate 2-reductase [Anaerolineaceae bacterium]|nr:2-dehydropantoate 2-reductase [Anaerolineaceae bacterium]
MIERVVVIGTGAMACLFAARLAASGQDVTMLGTWPEAIKAIKQGGVQVVDGKGGSKSYRVSIASEATGFPGITYVLVLIKSWQTERVARQIKDYIKKNDIVITLQNGLGNLETLVGLLGKENVIAGTTTLGSTIIQPGTVEPFGEYRIDISQHPRLFPFLKIFQNAGFTVNQTVDVDSLLWGKLIVNAGINPVSTLLEVPNGFLLTDDFARELVKDLVEEAVDVSSALEIQLPYANPLGHVENVIRQTSGNISSMLHDWLRGAPTEIGAITGEIIRLGFSAGVPTPVNQTVYSLIKARQRSKK